VDEHYLMYLAATAAAAAAVAAVQQCTGLTAHADTAHSICCINLYFSMLEVPSKNLRKMFEIPAAGDGTGVHCNKASSVTSDWRRKAVLALHKETSILRNYGCLEPCDRWWRFSLNQRP
jgi:hypothetical protein